MPVHRFAVIALLIGLAPIAAAQTPSLTAPESRTQHASTVNHAESGRIELQPTSVPADYCPTGDSGIRRQVFPIRFQYPFANNTYAVTLGLSGADIEQSRNLRLATSVEGRTRDGMTIVVWTWCNTVIYGNTRVDYLVAGRRPPR